MPTTLVAIAGPPNTQDRHRPAVTRRVPGLVRVAAAATIGHAVGAVLGVVLLAGPAARWSTVTGLLLVHLHADLGAALGAARAGRWARPVTVIGAVVLAGVLASAVVLELLGTRPLWLLGRATVVVLLAVVVVGPPARGTDVGPSERRSDVTPGRRS